MQAVLAKRASRAVAPEGAVDIFHRCGGSKNSIFLFYRTSSWPRCAICVLGEAHLRRILQAYARYYNDLRTHRSLNKDAPFSRPVQRIGRITSHVLLGRLHHHYCSTRRDITLPIVPSSALQ
jgi:hypothetical protein